MNSRERETFALDIVDEISVSNKIRFTRYAGFEREGEARNVFTIAKAWAMKLLVRAATKYDTALSVLSQSLIQIY